jgi:hypothetical protein
MRRFTKLSAVLIALSATVMAMSAGIVGTWNGKLVIDRGHLPRTTQGGEMSHEVKAAWQHVTLVLRLNLNNHYSFKVDHIPGSTPTELFEGTYARNGQTLVFTCTRLNGTTISPPTTMNMTVSRNEREITTQWTDGGLLWFSFTKS